MNKLKKDLVYINSGILFSHEERRYPAISDNTGGL